MQNLKQYDILEQKCIFHNFTKVKTIKNTGQIWYEGMQTAALIVIETDNKHKVTTDVYISEVCRQTGGQADR